MSKRQLRRNIRRKQEREENLRYLSGSEVRRLIHHDKDRLTRFDHDEGKVIMRDRYGKAIGMMHPEVFDQLHKQAKTKKTFWSWFHRLWRKIGRWFQ